MDQEPDKNSQTQFPLLEAILQPMTTDDLKTHFDEGRCLVLEGTANKFLALVTPEDIERRLNDGANASTFPQVIKDGSRGASTDGNCAWAPASLNKLQLLQDIQDGYSFMMANSSQVSRGLAAICDEIESFFGDGGVHADVHLYVSMNDQGNSYNAHRDRPQHKILLQAYGDANWQLFEPKDELPDNVQAIPPESQDEHLKLVSEFTLTQGDMLYMPPGTFHRVTSVPGPRISVSIPFYQIQDASRMDRTYIPFARLFNEETSD